MRICLISNASVYADAVLHSLLAYPELEISGLVECTALREPPMTGMRISVCLRVLGLSMPDIWVQ
ncbi:hypothetical protein [Pseudovibrio sp. Tun.PSC04-5.I4]|uniref:hypothetical protein n=1 Tax=Pseudovibrio sp. Tun.PSC04-5.I4 TaxID=1798213 RepID=UPI001AD8EDEE|nr:hypothetical protein [Pseudovibrio sp. Tun.PSC04-5.I4]